MSGLSYSGLPYLPGGCEQKGLIGQLSSMSDMVRMLELIGKMSDAQLEAVNTCFSAMRVAGVPASAPVSSGCESELSEDVKSIGSQISVNSSVSSARAKKRARAKLARKRRQEREVKGSEITYTSTEAPGEPNGFCYLSIVESSYHGVWKDQLGCNPTFAQLLRMPVGQLVPGWANKYVSRVQSDRYHLAATGPVGAYSCFASMSYDSAWPSGSIGDHCRPGFRSLAEVLVDKRPALTDTVGYAQSCDCRDCVQPVGLRLRGFTMAGTESYDINSVVERDLIAVKDWFTPGQSMLALMEMVEPMDRAAVAHMKVEVFSGKHSLSKIGLRRAGAVAEYGFEAPAWVVGVPPRSHEVAVGSISVCASQQPLLVAGRGLCRVVGLPGDHVYLRVMPSLRRFVHNVGGCPLGSSQGVLRYKLGPTYSYKPAGSSERPNLSVLRQVRDEFNLGDTFLLNPIAECRVPVGMYGSCVIADGSSTFHFPEFRVNGESVYVNCNGQDWFRVRVVKSGCRVSIGEDSYLIEDGGPSDDDEPMYMSCV